MRFSDTLLAVDPEYLKHENISPVLLYNIQTPLNLSLHMGKQKSRAECLSFQGVQHIQFYGQFLFVVF